MMPDHPSASNDPFLTAIQEAQDNLAESIERAGLRDDPIRYPLLALGAVIGLFPEFLSRTRQPLDPAALTRLETAAIKGSDRRAAALARAHNLRTLLLYGGSAVLLAAATLAAGYAWGHSAASASIQQTERRLALAFQDGPDAAAAWATLMELNDLPRAMALCTGPAVYADPAGRGICLLRVYTGPARRVATEAHR